MPEAFPYLNVAVASSELPSSVERLLSMARTFTEASDGSEHVRFTLTVIFLSLTASMQYAHGSLLPLSHSGFDTSCVPFQANAMASASPAGNEVVLVTA